MAGDVAITSLPALELADRLATGALRAVEVAEAFCERIAEVEPQVQAFAWFDRAFVLKQAAALDRHRATGRGIGALHGVPVVLKDVIDTAGLPTENGSPFDAGRVPTADAAVVERLKQAGALILGKTVTAALAHLHPGPTRNPAALDHTPGGSSSGSAAAVAAGMAALGVGTQTGGSVIRPASFCGVVGFKPSFGAISRRGVLSQSPTLDTVGVFARDVAGAALIAEVLSGHDPEDSATAPLPVPPLVRLARSAPPVRPAFAFVRTPWWNDADEETRAAFEEVRTVLAEACFEVPLPSPFDKAREIREIVNNAEMALAYSDRLARGPDLIAPVTRSAMEAGRAVSAPAYLAALAMRDRLSAGLEAVFDRCDAILTPAAPGPAPKGLGNTGDSRFNGLWTLCGVPAITLPLLHAAGDLPMGIQLVGRRGDDGRLLRTAAWLVDHLTKERGEASHA